MILRVAVGTSLSSSGATAVSISGGMIATEVSQLITAVTVDMVEVSWLRALSGLVS